MSSISVVQRSYFPILRPEDWKDFLDALNSSAEAYCRALKDHESAPEKVGYLLLGNIGMSEYVKEGITRLARTVGAWVISLRGAANPISVRIGNILSNDFTYARPMRCGATSCVNTAQSATCGFGVLLAHLLGIDLAYKKLPATADVRSIYSNVKANGASLVYWYMRGAPRTWSSKAHYSSSNAPAMSDPIKQFVYMLGDRLAKVLTKPVILTAADVKVPEDSLAIALPGLKVALSDQVDTGMYNVGSYFQPTAYTAFAMRDGARLVPEAFATTMGPRLDATKVATDKLDLIVSPVVASPVTSGDGEESATEFVKALSSLDWHRFFDIPFMRSGDFIDATDALKDYAAEAFFLMTGITGNRQWMSYAVEGSLEEWYGPEASRALPVVACLSSNDTYSTDHHDISVVPRSRGEYALSMLKSAWAHYKRNSLFLLATTKEGCKLALPGEVAVTIRIETCELDGQHPESDPYLPLSDTFAPLDSDGNELDATRFLDWDFKGDGATDKARPFRFKASDDYVVARMKLDVTIPSSDKEA